MVRWAEGVKLFMDAVTGGLDELSPDIFRALADNLPQLAWIAEAEGDIIWYNRRWYDYSGTTIEEMRGWGWRAIHHPDHVDRVVERFSLALEEGKAWEDIFPLRGRDGRYRTFLSRAQPLRDSAGRTAYWFGTNTDVTEQIAAEKRASYLLRLDELLRQADSASAALQAACELLRDELGASRVLYSAADVPNLRFEVTAEYLAPGVASVGGIHEVPQIVFDRLADRKVYVTPDWTAEEALASAAVDPDKAALPVRALMDLPHLRNGQLVGWLSVHQTTIRNWTEEEVALAIASAERTWSSVERARAEEQLRLSEDQFRGTAETLPGALFVTDAAGHNIYVNRFFKDYTGLDQELLGDGWVVIVHPDDLDRLQSAATVGKSSAIPFAAEYRMRRADGTYRWQSMRATPTLDQQGGVQRWIGVALDIHDAREAAAAARAAADEIEAIYASAPVGLTVLDRDLRYLRINTRLAEINGVPAADHIGRTVREVVPSVADAIEEALGEVLKGKEVFGVEVTGEVPADPGMIRTWRENWLPVRGQDGEITGVAVSAEDVTEEKEAELARRRAEERYRTVFNSAAVGIGRVAPTGEFLEINDRYCEILRRTRDQLLGGAWKDITHPDDLAGDINLVESALAGEIDNYALEKRYLAPDGSEIWVNLFVATERNADGSVEYFIPSVIDITEQKAAAAALRQSEERFRTLFGSMDQGFCLLRLIERPGQLPDYRFLEINPAFTRQSGLTEDVVGKTFGDVMPGLEEVWLRRYAEIVRTGKGERFLDHAAPLDRWFEVYAFPTGEPALRQIAVLFADVTERVRQEEALRASEQEMRLRLNAIPQMVWSTRPDGYHDFYNDRWYEFTGTPFGSTDGKGWNGIFHPDDQDRAREIWRHSLAKGEPYEIEYRLRHHDGQYRWVLGRALPIRNEAGEIVRWMGTCTDIDDRIAAAHALQESEARLRAVIEAAPIGLVFADATGRITGGNRRVVEILGHDVVNTGEVKDYSHDYVAFHSDGRQVEGEEYPLAKVIAGAERADLECIVQRGDGRHAWVRYEAAPIMGGDGNIVGGVVASLDIDREKRLTEGLEREVERVIAEREAAQEALRQSQKLEAMGQLTGGVAHDFNNLLTPIIGSLDLLQRKQKLDDRTGRLVEGALASAEKARVLVQRLLAFARRQPLKPQPIDLKRVIAEMSELVDSTSGPRIRVLTDVPEELPAALADGNQLEMAVLNLSVNARDAMPEGGTLSIAARSEPEGAGARLGLPKRPHVVLSVTDTGQGMDEDTRRRAIEPFFSTKGVGKGTGLGLSMVHGLAAQLGGALDIRSAPGMGTTIELWLPLASESVAGGAESISEAEAQGAGTVLLVDDEELVRASTAGMLADLGYRVVEAECGEAAIALVEDGLQPNLLVTDQLMPGLSGTDLALRLRDRFAGLPVLVVSGYADLDSLSPAFPHLSKPFRQAELAAALEKVRS
jgi:PAS domain S-box-containing protein